MLEEHANGESYSRQTYLPWELDRLREMNYIDAMALIRRRELLELGGYTEDHRLYGWRTTTSG